MASILARPKIIVCGSVNMDLVARVSRLPEWGECVQAEDFREFPGGKGANQALAAAKCGADAVLVGMVGDDPFGRQMKTDLAAAGVDVSYLCVKSGLLTGVGSILLDRNGRNCIVMSGGANLKLSTSVIDAAGSVLEESSLALVQLEVNLEAVKHFTRSAAQKGKRVILDPAPWGSFRPEFMEGVWAITPNETEASGITGIEVRDVGTAKAAGQKLLDMGVEHAVVKIGSLGAVHCEREGSYHEPGFRVEAVDTTAAGDVFAGALGVALAEGKPWEESLRFANAAAAISVTRFGALPSVPAREEVEKFLRNHQPRANA